MKEPHVSNAPPAVHSGVETRTLLIVSAGIAVVGFAGFAGWIANGDTLFWSLVQAGLAWCM